MTKVIIQIPCYNEAEFLGTTLDALPKLLPGIDKIEVLVVDDGSTDATIDVARRHGVNHIVKLAQNGGLARAYSAGLEASVAAGADIIVTTDADNQYDARDMEKLVTPVLLGQAEIVIGARPMDQFSWIKKRLQRVGSWVVKLASNANVADAPSGFRALTRDAAMRLNVFSEYTYTLETIIQAGQIGIAIKSVPIRTNPMTRPSRLVRSIPAYVWQSTLTISRIFITYRPLRFFAFLGLIIFGLGLIGGVRFILFLLAGEGEGHTQSLILSSLLMSMGFFVLVTGILADLISVNRKLLEQANWRLKKLDDYERRYAAGRDTLAGSDEQSSASLADTGEARNGARASE